MRAYAEKPAAGRTLQPAVTARRAGEIAINKPGDLYEQEAERAAAQVIAASGAGRAGPPSAKVSAVHAAGLKKEMVPPAVESLERDSGRPLAPATRAYMEPRFGHDFSRVRVHADGEAAQATSAVRARAYTQGSHIVFGAGEYAPDTPGGRRLLAHELAHVLQQASTPGLLQRDETKEGEKKLDQADEEAIAAAARAKPDIRLDQAMLWSAVEIVWALIRAHLNEYRETVGDVSYSRSIKAAQAAAGDQGLTVTVGQEFILGVTRDGITQRVEELRAAVKGALPPAPEKSPSPAEKTAAPPEKAPEAKQSAAEKKSPDVDKLSEPRQKVIQEHLPSVMGAKFKGAPQSPEKEKFNKLLPGVDVTEMRKSVPGYTTCGTLIPYILKEVGGVKDPGVASGGVAGVRDGIAVMITDPNDKREVPRNQKNKIQMKTRDLAAAKQAGGPYAWIDNQGRVFSGGAKGLGKGVWIQNTGENRHPKPGDVYLLVGFLKKTNKEGKEEKFWGTKHVGIFVSWKTNPDNSKTEIWETGDAGQGAGDAQEAVYSKEGGDQAARVYNPANRTITGKADMGTVDGWIDLDALLKASAEKEEEISREAEERLQKAAAAKHK